MKNYQNAKSELTETIQPATIPAITEVIKRCQASYNSSHPKCPIPLQDMGDIEGNTLEKVWRHRNTFDPSKAALSTWVWRIASNCISDYWEERGRRENWDSPEKSNISLDSKWGYSIDVADESGVESDLFKQEKIEWLNEHVKLLSERRRLVVEEIRKGTEREEIARQLGCTPGAVYKLYYDAIKALTEMLNADMATA